MAHENRTATDLIGLLEQLGESPASFEFFSLLRQLDRLNAPKPRTGTAARPAEEPVRFAQDPSLEFAPSSISSVDMSPAGLPPRIMVRFLGLLGPNGPLPLHLTEFAYDRKRHHNDHTFTRFLDIFHHRLLTLFYRSWSVSQPVVNFDRAQEDRFGDYVGSLVGIGEESLKRVDAMPDNLRRYFAGRFACEPRNAEGLQAIVGGFFKLPVKLQEFVGQWMEIPRDCRCQLGISPETSTLGENMMIGSHYWDRQQKIRLALGPMDYDDYRRLLPGGESLRRLRAIVRNYLGDEIDWDVKLILKKDQTPGFALGQAGELGWTNWLHSEPATTDADDLSLNEDSTLPALQGALGGMRL